tara:strand:- start:1118 stop:1891 length:774 start_codon:yes stop_codon:yes gene_type:complete
MKLVILAGGLGTRLSEETTLKPKPMVEIGGRPIIWHIMKYYSTFGINEFIICAGYKSYSIKEYFKNYYMHSSDVKFDLETNEVSYLKNRSENWKVSIIDTGLESMTGGRLRRIKDYVKDDEAFCFTYGDGLSAINIKDQINFHINHKKLATIAAVKPPGRYGALKLDKSNNVENFIEKPQGDGFRINGGFFILSPKVIGYIENDQTVWEEAPLENLTKDRQLVAFEYDGFWQPMDTLRDKNYLEKLWNDKKAPWKLW